MKKVIIVVAVIVLVIAFSFVYFFYLQPIKKNNPLMAVPPDASMIFQLENPFEEWNEITDNKIWNYLKTNPYFEEIGQEMDSLTVDMQSNSSLWELVMDRPMVMSIHKTRPKDYDFLYVIDLQRATQFDFIKNYINDFSDDIEKCIYQNLQRTGNPRNQIY